MRLQLADQVPGLDFYFQKSRLGMGCVPRLHFSQDFITELFEAFLVLRFFSAFSFLPSLSFQKDEAFTHLSCLTHALCWLVKHSPFYLFFRSLATSPVQKNDVHPPSAFSGLHSPISYGILRLTNYVFAWHSL